MDVATAASLTGHSVEVMLRHYRKVSDDDRAEAVRKAELGELDVEAARGSPAARTRRLSGAPTGRSWRTGAEARSEAFGCGLTVHNH
ncbi:MAG: hypothetical protein H6739_06940 [Alphaproteobacteria bacterium]|nr:hypothetical protein [Alphaproteobacteria bacterium]